MRISSIVGLGLALAIGCSKSANDGDKAAPTTGGGPATGGGGPAAAGGDDLCRLVTADEAGALLGGAPDAPQRVTNAMASVCAYPRAGGEIRIMKLKLNDIGEFAPKAENVDSDAERVAGIGDDAYVMSGPMKVVRFRKGLDQIAVFLTIPDQVVKPSRDALVELGKQAAARY
ncbi:MAG: hypothetical protein M3680_29575 [Myxococcota bacterium]|nr:hypothetical protein [Myxococcota bacterium]